jgi:tetratricopeptide (TPR) repeat protein
MIRSIFLFLLILLSTNIYAQEVPENLYRLRALGQAYVEEEDYVEAINAYQEAAAMMPQSVSDVFNLGYAQFKNDENAAAVATLKRVLALDESNPYTNYVLGLAYKKDGQSNELAIQHFRVAAGYPDADTAPVYNLGLMLNKANQLDEAVEWLEKVRTLDPTHSATVYNLAMIANRQQNTERRTELFKIFQELKKDEGQKPADAFDVSKFAKPIVFDIPAEFRVNVASTLRPTLKPNEEWTKRLHDAAEQNAGNVLAVYQDPVEKITYVVIVTNKTWLLSIHQNHMDKLELHEGNDWEHAKNADFDNDGVMDVLLYKTDAVQLIKVADGSTENVSTSAGIPNAGAVDALWVDYDHEGDLDFLLAHPEGDHILQNNGDGTFTNVTGKVEGLDLNGSIALAVADLDLDNDIDIVRGKAGGSIEVFSNQRESIFKKVAEDEPQDGATSVIIETGNALSPDKTSLVLSYPNLSVFEVLEPRAQWEMKSGFGSGNKPSVPSFWAKPVDFNNDGYDDLFCNNRLVMFSFRTQNQLMASWRYEFNLKYAEPVDWDFDGDLDLVVTYENNETAVIENDGGNQNKSITLALHGDKNNAFGYGSKVEVKDGLFHTLQEVWNTPVHVGLGNRDEVDVVRTTWPNGIFQNVIHATAGQIISVTEKPGYAGSCPFVYAWNGERMEFVSDFLSTGPLGLFLGNGYFPPRPNETVRIRGDQLQPKDGLLELRLTEELREVIYMDQVELLSVDQSADIELFVNERFTVPPFPEFGLTGMSSQARPPKRVMDQDGNDVTSLITKNDHQYLRPFNKERFDGVGSLHSFEMAIDDSVDLSNAVMFLTGYINWADSSIVRHIAQNPEMDFIMPYLDVWNEKGEWETVMNPMGFPAGKLKTIPIDLSEITFGFPRKLRITATVQIHWDRILIDPAPVRDGFEIASHKLQHADFQYGGFSEEYELAGTGPTWYDYSKRTSNQKYDFQIGQYTRYGDVGDVLNQFDDQYVIMATGDEIVLQFTPTEIPDGMTRTYFMRAHGWVKDLDHSTAYGQTVDPLPFQAMTAYPYGEDEVYPYFDNADYLGAYNTRSISDPIEPLKTVRVVNRNSEE